MHLLCNAVLVEKVEQIRIPLSSVQFQQKAVSQSAVMFRVVYRSTIKQERCELMGGGMGMFVLL